MVALIPNYQEKPPKSAGFLTTLLRLITTVFDIYMPRRVIMNKDDFQRFEYLSKKSISGEPSKDELKELQQLMFLWNISVQNKEQLSSICNKHF